CLTWAIGARLSAFATARTMTLPPSPPSPPSGPPRGTYFSRRKLRQPRPPSPPLTYRTTRSTNISILRVAPGQYPNGGRTGGGGARFTGWRGHRDKGILAVARAERKGEREGPHMAMTFDATLKDMGRDCPLG